MYTSPFLFPEIQSPVLPDPSQIFSPHLLSSPLPTNSFFQNFAVKDGDLPVYVQPYLVKSSNRSLSICFPLLIYTLAFVSQAFSPDLTVSTAKNSSSRTSLRHVITSYDDLSVTLRLPPDLTFYLVRGSPYLTFTVDNPASLTFSTNHSFLSVSPNPSFTKHTVTLSNNQTWLLYSSSPLHLTSFAGHSRLISKRYSGLLRLAALPSPQPHYQTVLDRYSSRYPVSGTASLPRPFCLKYEWRKKGSGGLLLLAHPLHVQLFTANTVKILDEFKYDSIDGDLVGIVAEKWFLEIEPIPVTWHSIRGVDRKAYSQIRGALSKDVEALDSNPIATNSSYFYGKEIARAARLILIAEEVRFPKVIPTIRKFLGRSITPWLEGKFKKNAFFYDPKWGGMVTRLGSLNTAADFGFGIYNDHHFHLGYFLYTIAVLAKIDPVWGRKYKPQAYSMMADFMNLGRRQSSNYPKLRCFDMWMLHSWAAGLTEYPDGRNQESTSEAVNAYYSAALMGLSYGDTDLAVLGSSLAAFEIRAAQQWWHVKEGSPLYKEFDRENRVVGILWSTKRDSTLWFAPPEWRECRLGIQLLPLLPITEVLFRDIEYAKELVKWAWPALKRKGVGEGWKGFIYALQALYGEDLALEKIGELKEFDDGNSLSNLLWWVHSRGYGEKNL